MSKESKKFRSKYDILFNFCGISNGKFPVQPEKKILIQNKRYKPDEDSKENENENENDSKKNNQNDNEDNDINEVKPLSKLKISYYDGTNKKNNDEIKLNEEEEKIENENENKNDIMEQINLEENDLNNNEKAKDVEEVKDSEEMKDVEENNEVKPKGTKDNKTTKKKRSRKKKKDEEEDLSYSMSKSSSKIVSESVSLNSSITPPSEDKKTSRGKRKKNTSKDDSSKISEDPNKSKTNTESLDPIKTKELFSNPHDCLPDFLKPENIRDKNHYRPDDPNYDCNTLYVPTEYLKEQSDAMIQFWEFKKEHFDKVIFFKVGKFYEMFYDDAIICNQLLDIKWMGDDPKKLHVGFPEVVLESKASVLVEAGFKIAIVEQTETPKQLKERLKTDRGSEKAVKRKLCGVLTKGTYFKYEEDLNSMGDNTNKKMSFANTTKNKFCISIFRQEKDLKVSQEDANLSKNLNDGNALPTSPKVLFGICIFDITTLQFYLGKIEEDPPKFTPKSQTSQMNESNYSKIKSLLYNIAPEEVICVSKNIPEIMMNFIKGLTSKPLINNLKNNYKYSELNDLCVKYFGEDFEKWNPLIINLFENEKEKYVTCVAFYLTIVYLEKIFLAKNTLPISSFHDYSTNITLNPKKKMILDYQVITNLELLESKYDPRNPEVGSFVEYFNKAVSPFGKRLLRNWILNPLCDVDQINERLDIIEDLIHNDIVITKFRDSLSRWMDLERQCTKFFKLALETNQKDKDKESNYKKCTEAIYSEDMNKNRMHDFFKLINFLADCQKIFLVFQECVVQKKFKSEAFVRKVTIGEGVPNLTNSIKMILNNFQIIDSQDEKGNPITKIKTKPGKYPDYDKNMHGFEEVNKKFNEILTKERKRLKCNIIKYAHTKNIRYELEIPENVVKDNRPKDYLLTTSKKGFLRFHTKEIVDNVKKLEELEEELRTLTGKLNSEIFKIFYNQRDVITSFVNVVAEIDCLTALAFVSIIDRDKFSRPKFISLEDNNGQPYLELKDCVHPCLLDRTPYFVPNDVVLGKDNKSLIVITGPNMGGKSTLLRQVCIATIIAQIGCFVPAKKCVMTIVDRIFTRIGANDKLLEGKSTFFIEMEETKTILESATKNSLIIMDELGRGTSTKDGQIIAKTILYQIENKLSARCLFTTHYHDIIEWCRSQPKIKLSFMDSNINDQTKDITFLYKFKDGVCPESYGIEVAKLAGLPQKIINIARDIKEHNKLAIQ